MSVVSRQKNWVVTVNNYTLSPYCCHLWLLVQIQNSFKNNHICRNTGRSNRFILAYFQNMYRICLTSGWMKNGLFFTLESNSDLRYYTPGKFWFKPIKSTWAPLRHFNSRSSKSTVLQDTAINVEVLACSKAKTDPSNTLIFKF